MKNVISSVNLTAFCQLMCQSMPTYLAIRNAKLLILMHIECQILRHLTAVFTTRIHCSIALIFLYEIDPDYPHPICHNSGDSLWRERKSEPSRRHCCVLSAGFLRIFYAYHRTA